MYRMENGEPVASQLNNRKRAGWPFLLIRHICVSGLAVHSQKSRCGRRKARIASEECKASCDSASYFVPSASSGGSALKREQPPEPSPAGANVTPTPSAEGAPADLCLTSPRGSIASARHMVPW